MTMNELLYRGECWHQLPSEYRDSLFKTEGLTVGEVMQAYPQPEWCEYPEALCMEMGCWSLCWYPERINRAFCARCDLYSGPIYARDVHGRE